MALRPSHPGPAYDVATVPGPSSSEPLSFTVAASDEGALYLAWDQDEGLRFTRRAREGADWSAPQTLQGDGVPTLFADGDRVVLFVRGEGLERRVSEDGGATWSEPAYAFGRDAFGRATVSRDPGSRDVVSRDTAASYPGEVRVSGRPSQGVPYIYLGDRSTLHRGSGGDVYLVYLHQESYVTDGGSTLVEPPHRIYFSHSDDLGERWTPPVAVADTEGRLGSAPSVVDFHGALVLCWSERYRRGDLLRVATSLDGGATWSEPITLNTDAYVLAEQQRSAVLVTAPRLVRSGHDLYLCYGGRGLQCLEARGVERALGGASVPGQAWSPAFTLTGSTPLAFDFLSAPGAPSPAPAHRPPPSPLSHGRPEPADAPEAPLALWVDQRHQEVEWWGYSFALTLFKGGNPRWANNDLIVARLGEEGSAEERVLTPHLSYTRGSIGAVQAQGRWHVFWSGKERVDRNGGDGRHRTDSAGVSHPYRMGRTEGGIPYRVFYTSVPLELSE
ncbi:MAG: sialidase family protein [Rhodothermales bacterium]